MIGHAWAVQLLKKHISKDRVRHAYLFTGPDSVGKRTLALRFAQSLNCERLSDDFDFCGECAACRQIENQAYPDVRMLVPTHASEALKVEEMRDLSRWLALTPYQAQRRMVILANFHQANESAANALLKTLEEPPRHVVLILTARSREDLLPTIVSRCEVLSLRSLPIEELEEILLQREGASEREREVARLSGGNPGTALRLLSDPEVVELRSQRLNELLTVLKSNRIDRFAYADGLAKNKELQERRSQALQVLGYWQLIWRDALMKAYGADVPVQNPDQMELIERISLQVSEEDALKVIKKIQHTSEAIQRNANVRLALESLMLDLPYLQSG